MKQINTLKFTLLFCCMCASHLVHAQNFHLVKDVNPYTDSYPGNQPLNSTTAAFAVYKGAAYFTAIDGIHGNELWRSDGTKAGTVLVKDVNPGPMDGNIGSISVFNDKLVFITSEGFYLPRKLWISDGTDAGTTVLMTFPSGDAYITEIAIVGDNLFFALGTDAGASTLWKTDGTITGTKMVADFNTADFGFGSALQSLANYNGKLYFSLTNNAGDGLWQSDGTAAGTHVVKNIGAGLLTVIGSFLYFASYDGVRATLWRTDGTEAGTIALPWDNSVGMLGGDPKLNVIKHTLFLRGQVNVYDEALYKYDLDSLEGPEFVHYMHRGSSGYASNTLITVNDSLIFFTAYDSVQRSQLWVSTGDSLGTTVLLNNAASTTVYYNDFTSIGSKLYFQNFDYINGFELWSSDGTVTGTGIVKDIFPGIFSSKAGIITALDASTVLFSASDGIKGTELWKTDGTANGTLLVKDINTTTTSTGAAFASSAYSYGVINNDQLLISLTEGRHGSELWRTDGTANGTYIIKDVVPGTLPGFSSNSAHIQKFKNNYYYFANSFTDTLKLWKTTGEQNNGAAAEIFIGYSNLDNHTLAAGTDLLYFVLYQDKIGYNLMVTDGVSPSQIAKANLNLAYYSGIVTVNNNAYFINQEGNGAELWTSDGMPGGTRMIKDIKPGFGSSNPSNLTVFNGKLYFSADDGSGNHLWVTDGTEPGTTKIKAITIQPRLQRESRFTTSNSKFYFAGDNGVTGLELWVSDGTPDGTMLVKDINAGSASSNISNMIDVNGILYFTANDGIHGNEIWKSDGTAAGTVLVKDVTPGSDGSTPLYMVNSDGVLCFVLNDHLWASDGSAAGTVEVSDTGLEGLSGITNLIAAGDKLYFSAYTYKYGSELYEGQAGITLPITLLSFNGNLAKNDALLKWTTTNEVHNSYFNIQRSTTGTGFATVGKVNAAGSITSTHDYNFTDANVTSLGANALYYRLQQVDADDKSTYSNIIKLDIASAVGIVISPNPARNVAYIHSATNISNALITITDMNGHTLYTAKRNIQAGVQIPVNVSMLAAGTYNITIQAGGVAKKQLKLLLE